MKLTEAERLKIIEQTPYAINDAVLLKDFKFLFEQAKKLEWLKEAIKCCNDEGISPESLATQLENYKAHLFETKK